MAVIGKLDIVMAAYTQQFNKAVEGSGEVVTTVQTAVAGLSGAMGQLYDAVNNAIPFIWGLVEAGSELNDELDRTERLFGEHAESIVEYSKQMRNEYGELRKDTIRVTADLGNLFRGAGMADEQAAELGITVHQLAADLAALDAVSIESTAGAIEKAMQGRFRAIKALGVEINNTLIEARALELGLADVDGNVDTLATRMATLDMIVEQTGDAHGYLEASIAGTSGQLQVFSGHMDMFASEAGLALQPVSDAFLHLGVSVFGTLVEKIYENTDAITDWVDTTLVGGGYIESAIGAVGETIAFVADLVQGAQGAAKGFEVVLVHGFMAAGVAGHGLISVFETLINLIPGVSVEMTEATSEIVDELKLAARTSSEEFQEMMDEPLAGDRYREFFDEIADGVSDTVEHFKEMDRIASEIDDSILEIADAVDKLEESLQDQINTFGMSATESQIAKMEALGATDEQLESIRQLTAELEGLEEIASMEKEAEALRQSVLTPAEKLIGEIDRYQQLFAEGLIDKDTFDRALDEAIEDADVDLSGDELAEAMESGSQEARRALLSAMGGLGGRDTEREMLDTNRSQAERLQELVDLTRESLQSNDVEVIGR